MDVECLYIQGVNSRYSELAISLIDRIKTSTLKTEKPIVEGRLDGDSTSRNIRSNKSADFLVENSISTKYFGYYSGDNIWQRDTICSKSAIVINRFRSTYDILSYCHADKEYIDFCLEEWKKIRSCESCGIFRSALSLSPISYALGASYGTVGIQGGRDDFTLFSPDRINNWANFRSNKDYDQIYLRDIFDRNYLSLKNKVISEHVLRVAEAIGLKTNLDNDKSYCLIAVPLHRQEEFRRLLRPTGILMADAVLSMEPGRQSS